MRPTFAERTMHEDQKYIEALRTSDGKLLGEIYARFFSRIQHLVIRHGGSAADTKDVFQEALTAIFEKARKPNFALTCQFGSLLHVVCYRKWIDRLRKKGLEDRVREAEETRYNTEFEQDVFAAAEQVLEAESKHRRLAEVFGQLSELCRKLLTLLYSEGLAPEEVAKQLRLNSMNTFYVRKKACLERLKVLLSS